MGLFDDEVTSHPRQRRNQEAAVDTRGPGGALNLFNSILKYLTNRTKEEEPLRLSRDIHDDSDGTEEEQEREDPWRETKKFNFVTQTNLVGNRPATRPARNRPECPLR